MNIDAWGLQDNLIARTREALRCEAARSRNITNLRNWLGEFGCLAREESAYLWHDDLMSVGPSDPDTVIEAVAGPVEDGIIWLSSVLGKVRCSLLRSVAFDLDFKFMDVGSFIVNIRLP